MPFAEPYDTTAVRLEIDCTDVGGSRRRHRIGDRHLVADVIQGYTDTVTEP